MLPTHRMRAALRRGGIALAGLLLLGWMSAAVAQPSPPSQTTAAVLADTVDTVSTPPQDNAQLLLRDEATDEPGPLRFAEPTPVHHTPDDVGTWETLDDGRHLWRLRVVSDGAESLNLGFNRYVMPPEGELYLYGTDGGTWGPFTADDNDDHQLWTPIIPGDEVTIEVVLPDHQRPHLELELSRINHGYRPFRDTRAKQSGSCNIDTLCPEAAPWRNEARSVGLYTVGGQFLCTGALVNNTSEDLTPFFLTADHCAASNGFSASDATSVVVYWNFENSFCRAPEEAGGEGDAGSLDPDIQQVNTGASLAMAYSGSQPGIAGGPDAALLELDEDVDPDVDPFYAGWNRTDTAPSAGVGVHHPRGEEKRIAFSDRPTDITGFGSSPPSAEETHLYVEAWDEGTTEPGSSGSPLLDEDNHVVGVLSGGLAACDGTEPNDEPDWYGRLAEAWDGGGTSDTRLQDHLDPEGANPESLDGINAVQDVDPPAPIAQLDTDVTDQRDGITLSWTATGGNDTEGTVLAYDVRYDTSPIRTRNDFQRATRIPDPPLPQPAGTRETFTVRDLEPRKPFYFALRAINTRGDATPITESSSNTVILDTDFILNPPYPNPVRTTATVTFAVDDAQPLTIDVYDATGQHIKTAHQDTPVPNRQEEVSIRVNGLASGQYFVRLQGEDFTDVQPMTVVR